jgi:pSer/pThr/pTyr-binding forkhead associated (FHA) protein
MNAVENICPNCREKNALEEVICIRCGAVLEDPFMDPGAQTKQNGIPAVVPGGTTDWPIDKATVPDRGIAVYLEGESSPIFRGRGAEFIIGRKAESPSQDPEGFLDLSPLGGYSHGISRRHVVIRQAEAGYAILDLGSVNGTWLNNERLAPQKYYPLPSGAHIRLGSMRLYVVYRPGTEK